MIFMCHSVTLMVSVNVGGRRCAYSYADDAVRTSDARFLRPSPRLHTFDRDRPPLTACYGCRRP